MNESWDPVVLEIASAIQDLISKLNKICDEIGFNENARRSYCEQAHHHLTDLIKEMIAEAETKKRSFLETVNLMNQELHALSMELKMDPPSDFNDLSLMETQIALENHIEFLKHLKNQRLNYLNELLEKENSVCKALGVQPLNREEEGVPSEEDLNNFKCYLAQQEAEKNRLENIFKDTRKSILKMMDELSIVPSLDFETLVCKNSENFVYSSVNMTKLRELHDKMIENLEDAKEKANFQREELKVLWKYLGVPKNTCQIFLEKHSGHSLADINLLNEEIKKCKQKRTENIAKYVERVRDEMRELWDVCKFGEEERSKFKLFHIQNYTEDVLTLHELEVDRLRKYYHKNRKIYELLREREKLWEKAAELEQRANDPDRLHNRGGQLLAEEKDRKAIQKKLPQIDERLEQMMEQYAANNDEPFKINGVTFQQFIKQSWQEYCDKKDTLKKARQAKIKDKSTKKTPVISTSRRTAATTSSLLRSGYISRKRKDEKSPIGNSAKRRNAGSEKPRPTVLSSRIRRSGTVSRRVFASNITTTKASASGCSRNEVQPANETQSTICSVSQYEKFQAPLADRTELRSSLLPEQVLKNAHGKSKMRTPVKTPVKPLRKKLLTPNSINRTPKSSHPRDQSRSPRITNTPRLATAPSTTPFFF